MGEGRSIAHQVDATLRRERANAYPSEFAPLYMLLRFGTFEGERDLRITALPRATSLT